MIARRLISLGNFVIPVILIRFPEDKDRSISNPGTITAVLNGGNADLNPVGSVREYLYYSSMKKLNVTYEVIGDWGLAPETAAFYADGVSGLRDTLIMQKLFSWRLEELDAEIDWSRFDQDGDKMLDNLLVLTSSIPAEYGYLVEPCPLLDYKDRIWSQGSALAWEGGWESSTGYTLQGYVITRCVARVFLDPSMDPSRVLSVLNLCHCSGVGLYKPCDEPAPNFEMGIATHETLHTCKFGSGGSMDPFDWIYLTLFFNRQSFALISTIQ